MVITMRSQARCAVPQGLGGLEEMFDDFTQQNHIEVILKDRVRGVLNIALMDVAVPLA